MAPIPNQSNVFTALRSFLLAILPPGVEVIRAQANLVPEPASVDFVIMTPLRQERLETNIDNYADTFFTASIASNVMNVTNINFGTISVGNVVFGINIPVPLNILAQVSGTGGVGTYSVSNSQDILSQQFAAGAQTFTQHVKWSIQLDVHGPNSPDNATTISTLFRDDYAVQQFLTSGFDVAPLYADDPKQLPFTNDQNQVEDRWVIEACLQANQVISASQQFASALTLNLVEVP